MITIFFTFFQLSCGNEIICYKSCDGTESCGCIVIGHSFIDGVRIRRKERGTWGKPHILVKGKRLAQVCLHHEASRCNDIFLFHLVTTECNIRQVLLSSHDYQSYM